jgi:ATP/maltotriose-dependent transcriptional regulator MalT/two-component SAPR family response regulator
MPRDELLLRTKLSPPRPHRRVLPRAGLLAKLRETLDYRLTLVQAGTGYGKSTALAALGEGESPLNCVWYSLSEADADPQRFLSYLIEAFRLRLPALSDLPLVVLQEVSQEGTGGAWPQVIDALVNALADVVRDPVLLIVDDYHFVANSPEVTALSERFITYMPPDVHVLVSTRYPLNSAQLVAWRAKSEVLEIGHDDLVFQPDEVEALFHKAYHMQLTPEEIAALVHKTEGWPIALQLVWQGLRNSAVRSAADLLAASPPVATSTGPAALGALFDYLAHDVLDRQPTDIAAFLRDTAVLRELTPAACDAVTRSFDGAAMLNRIHQLDLFVVALGASGRHYRYHHLFHEFLRGQLAADPARARDLHRRAAEFFHGQPDEEEAIYHWLAAQAFPEAAAAVEAAGEAALRAGRLDTVARWIDALPPETLVDHPRLQVYLGDVYRLRSRFDEALAWYAQARRTWEMRGDLIGVSRALRGQALVYLDTVQPARAESLLEEALRLTEGLTDLQARARMLELLAENKLNMGKADEAEALRAEARALREDGPGEDALSVRVKLRTGQLDDAQQILEAWAEAERREAERGQMHPPRSHRETVLILSLIHSLRGQAEQAFARAQEGIALSERLESPFITAVAHIRLGHAWQLRRLQTWPPQGGLARDEAIRCYQTSIALGDRLAVRRLRAEAMWGLTRAYGFSEARDLESAQRAAAEGVEIGRWAGDPWVTAHIEMALGASYVLAGRAADAVDILTQALITFRECGDSLGRAASRLWLCLAYFDLQQAEHFASCIDDLLAICEAHRYDFLFTMPTLLGPPDPHRLIPLLLEARARRRRPTYANRLLARFDLPDIQLHPGYQLRVQSLGGFRIWRGETEVDPRDWKRDKARQLFQLLLTHRSRPLQREAIAEQLWPDLSPEAASRDFKVALNAVNKALEPARAADRPSAYIAREGAAYFLRPEADLWLDAAVFERESEAGLRPIDSNPGESEQASTATVDQAIAHLKTALRLYAGDYLPEAIYEDWASAERERLAALYLRAADRLAGALIDRGQYDEGLSICQLILARDPCWESAYRMMMIAHARQGNRPQALRVYQRCVSVLRKELDVDPSPATVATFDRIAQTGEAA